MRRRRCVWLVAIALLVASGVAEAQESSTSAPVSREEFEAMRKELTSVKRELAELKAEREAAATATTTTTTAATEAVSSEEDEERLAEVEETIEAIQRDLRDREPGDTGFLLTGNATLSYVDREGDDSTFNAVFRPTLLWELGQFDERLLFESKLEIRLNEGTEETDVFLESANLSYILNGSAIVGAGKFLTPFGLYVDRFYPPKWAEEPLIYSRDDGIAPHSSVGVFLRGTVPMVKSELNYATWISNGPLLETDGADVGTLNFSDTPDGNDDKAVGARVGFLPWPALEIGGSVLTAGVSPDGDSTRALLLGVDAQYVKEIEWLGGVIDVRAEYVWSDVDDVTFDPTGAGGFGPLTFNNRRSGGYVELSYRPSKSESKFVRSLEFLGRWEVYDTPDAAPGSFDAERFTIGTSYWLTPTISLRAAYQFDNRERTDDQDALLLQVGVGL